MKNIEISIITVNLNNSEGLLKTIKSIKYQTHQNFEHIIIDGGSSDDSKKIIKKNEDFLSCWVSEKDEGIYQAMNKGISNSRGEYVLFLNSGDYLLHNDSLFIASKYLNGTDHVSFTGKIGKDLDNCYDFNYSQKTLDHKFFFASSLMHPSTFSRRNLFFTYGFFDEKLRIVSDWKFFYLTILKNNCSYLLINYPISFFENQGISSHPHSIEEIAKERKTVIKSEFPGLYQNLKELNQFQLFKYSKMAKILTRLKLYKSLLS